MKRLHNSAAVAALALSLTVALAGPALAQQAAVAPTGTSGQEAAADSGQRAVTGRELMTPEERASFRSQMQQATPEQRQQLWGQKRAELGQRAAQRGLVLAEPGSRSGGNAGERSEGRRGGREGGRGEGGSSMMSRMMGGAPRGP